MHRRALLVSLAPTPLLSSGSAGTAAGRPTPGRSSGATAGQPEPGRAVAWEHASDAGGTVSEQLGGLPAHGLPLAADDDLVLVGGEGLTALDPGSGEPRWVRGDLTAPGALHLDNVVHLFDADGTLRALDRTDGETAWALSVPVERVADVVAPPTPAAGRVVVAADDWIGAIADGRVVWERLFDGDVTGLASGGDEVVATVESAVVALDAETGERRWRTGVAGVDALVAPTSVGGRVVAVGLDGGVYAARPNGAVAAGFAPDGHATWRAGSVATADRAVVVRTTYHAPAERAGPDDATDARLVVSAHDPADGTATWTRTEPAVVDSEAREHGPNLVGSAAFVPPVLRDGVAYVAGFHRVFAVDAATGKSRGQWALSGGIARVAVAGDTLLLAGADRLGRAGRDRLLALAPADCEPVSIAAASARYEFPIPQSRQVQANVAVPSGDCRALVSATLLYDDEPVATVGEDWPVARDGATLSLQYPTDEFPRDETVTVRLRGTAGSLLAERTLDVSDYRDEPAILEVDCASVDRRTASPGEPVTATLQVLNRGYATGYEARLLADGDQVATHAGDVSPVSTDQIEPCMGAEVTLTHAFESSGEYDLRAVVEPAASEGERDEVALGRVTVEGDTLAVRPSAAVLGVGGGLLAVNRLSGGDSHDG